jgi:hypothetical protein
LEFFPKNQPFPGSDRDFHDFPDNWELVKLDFHATFILWSNKNVNYSTIIILPQLVEAPHPFL